MEKTRTLTAAVLLAALLVAGPAAGQPVVPAAVSRPASQPASQPDQLPPGVVQFQPGIRIDWHHHEVQAEATVVLRKGLIELFACSPRTREYESIVRMDARATHLYQALGLLGLTPGHPLRMDPKSERVETASGDPVEILVRYETDGKRRQEFIERWLRLAGTHQPISPLPWVFAGSVPAEGGGIAADSEGTVVALVDFSTSLVALPQLHSDRNEELWLEPATEKIPPEQTRCTLVFRPGPLRLELDATGRVRADGQGILLSDVGRLIERARAQKRLTRVELRIDPQRPAADERALLTLLEGLRVPRERISIVRSSTASAPAAAQQE